MKDFGVQAEQGIIKILTNKLQNGTKEQSQGLNNPPYRFYGERIDV